jgi:thymidylate synthase (FAD)
MTNQIIVQLNPDVPPTGSDLGIVNAARKSFGRRSEWANEEDLWCSPWVPLGDEQEDEIRHEMQNPYVTPVLKDKDKRLLEFLARGMTADDFDEFKDTILASKLDDMSSDFYLKNLTEHMWEFRNTPTHDTPFNHGFFSFEVKAPVFVARHLVKHEYLIMSEYSRRYITDDVEFYRHEYRSKAEDVKQGSGGIHENSVEWQIEIESANTDSIERYNRMVADRVAPEQARGHLPQDLMTSWTWSGTLGAFANMCKLRLSKDTQYETRLVAQGVYTELKKQFPIAAPLLVEGVL